jgi:PRC-barrel domain
MRFPSIDEIKNSRRQALRVLVGGRLTLFGVAGLLMASAVVGVAVPQAKPGQQLRGSTGVTVDASVKRMPGDTLVPLVGKKLRTSSGADIGQVSGVLVDAASEPRAVIVKFGGFLGVGVRTVAVDWQALRMPAGGKRGVLLADLAPQQLAQAPQYKPTARSIAVVTAPGAGASLAAPGYDE